MRALTLTLIAAAAVILSTGCAQEKSAPASTTTTTDGRGGTSSTPTPAPTGTGATPTPPPGTGTDSSTTGYDSGATATLVPSSGMLAALFYNSNPNSPTNVRVNIDISKTSEAVIISYMESGRFYEARFGTTHPRTGVQNSMYNGWVNQGGTNVWKGFFQDAYGAIIVIVNRSLGTGDGTANFVGGSIWFQNFTQAWPNNPNQGPAKVCWEIQWGPYDCRSFLVGSVPGSVYDAAQNVQMTSSLYPNNYGPVRTIGYRKLGDFDGLARAAAGF